MTASASCWAAPGAKKLPAEPDFLGLVVAAQVAKLVVDVGAALQS